MNRFGTAATRLNSTATSRLITAASQVAVALLIGFAFVPPMADALVVRPFRMGAAELLTALIAGWIGLMGYLAFSRARRAPSPADLAERQHRQAFRPQRAEQRSS